MNLNIEKGSWCTINTYQSSYQWIDSVRKVFLAIMNKVVIEIWRWSKSDINEVLKDSIKIVEINI